MIVILIKTLFAYWELQLILVKHYLILVADTVYFTFMGSLRFSFPPETLLSIRQAALGIFTNLKQGISGGFKVLIMRFTKRNVTEEVKNNLQQP